MEMLDLEKHQLGVALNKLEEIYYAACVALDEFGSVKVTSELETKCQEQKEILQKIIKLASV